VTTLPGTARTTALETTERFQDRHIGPRPAERDEMLRAVGAPSLDALIDRTIPAPIRLEAPLDLPAAESENDFLRRLRGVAAENRVFRSFVGMGYYDCIVPSVIQRMVFENPGWYTPYTPYQAEIAQGRLESLLNFQTMVRDLTGMEVATASLLDEATAAAEAMTMLYRVRGAAVRGASRFLVADTCYPQTLAVLAGRSEPLGIRVDVMPLGAMRFGADVFGVLVQTPDDHGHLWDLHDVTSRAHETGALVAVATDLLALTIVTPPGEMGADVVIGSAQRFGVPMGYGGPHAAFFATRARFVRQMPGRIIGVSVDAHGAPAYRMALQTREQHIRREKATSNICTAQALLANMAAMYAVYHGADGLQRIGRRVHALARTLADALERLGCPAVNAEFFDTLRIRTPGAAARVRVEAEAAGLNLRYYPLPAGAGVGRSSQDPEHVGIALDEPASIEDVRAIAGVVARALGKPAPVVSADVAEDVEDLPASLRRTSAFLTHPVFTSHRSETQMMRYVRRLERKDVGLDTSMIALGSCTMKLNAASEMRPLSWEPFARMHPFAPVEQAAGYARIRAGLERALSAITGLEAVSLQPNSGAQGELAGLMVIRAYLRDRGEGSRDVVLIPSSAHGTNPASATMAGLQVVVVACDAGGNVDLADLRAKAAAHRDALAALMITYPSTHGVFEEQVREVCAIVHEHGGQVYLDGANMNAQVGLTSPGRIGADVCHLNLHKTFAIPHGGGGPGMGPIAVAKHLAPYLPRHPVIPVGGERAIPPVAAAPWGSASILLISYAYICLLGARGLTDATRYAILNANYVKARLERHYPVLYTGTGGGVAHELIFDLRAFKRHGIEEQDVAKRLMDYGFHAPTVSFPVPGTLMVEPTESESKDELDRFCEAMIAIRSEIRAVIDGEADPRDNVLKNAPHTAAAVAADAWPHPYTREQAAFPLPFVRATKFWPPVGRIDNPYGDRNLVCACPPIEAYLGPFSASTGS
jgi:glycine dehydrogenase